MKPLVFLIFCLQKRRPVYRMGLRPVSNVTLRNQVRVHRDSWVGFRAPASSRSRTGGRIPGPSRLPVVRMKKLASAVASALI